MSIARRFAVLAVALALLSGGGTAQAFFESPRIIPANPMAGETVSVGLRHGICDSIIDGEPGFPQISQTGNAIRIVYYGVHYEPGDELCIFGVGTIATSLGNYAPGDYTLSVDLAYLDPTTSAPAIYPVGNATFSVDAPLRAAPAPAIGITASSMLASLVLAIALIALKSRRFLFSRF